MAHSLITITGLRELDNILRNELPRRAGKRALSGAVAAGARIIRDEAKRRAPVGTGNLRRNIYIFKIRERQTEHSVAYAISVRTKGKRGDRTNAWYWTFVEFGTKHIAAQPFLRPAIDAKKEEVVRVVRDVLLQKIIVEVVRGTGLKK